MGYYKTVPFNIGKGEGGSKIAEIETLLNALAADLNTLYVADGALNVAARTLRGTNETTYQLAGDIADESAAAVENATVTAYIKDTSDVAGAALTDSDGYFTMQLYPGVYDIQISKNGYTTVSVDDTTMAANNTSFDQTLASELEVLSQTPASGATAAQPSTTIVLTFDRALTDNSAGGKATGVGATVTGSVSGDLGVTSWAESGTDVTITMDAILPEGEEITVEFAAAATVKGSNDELLGEDYEYTFTTGYTYLVVDVLTPLDEATDVARLNSITVEFTVNLTDASPSENIEDGITVEVGGTPVTISDATVSTDTLTITLASYIECQGQLVEVTVNKADTISTATGGILENDLEFSFTMEDYLEVSSTVPVSGTGTSEVSQIDIVFPVTLTFQDDAAAAAAVIVVTDGGTPISFSADDITLEDSGGTDNVLRITPDTAIAEDNQTVTVTIPVADTVKGPNGELLEEDYVYSFTMANTP